MLWIHRNLPLWLSIGFCFLGVLEATNGLRFSTNRFDEIALYVGLWSPVFLAAGAALLSMKGRSARLCLWTLSVWWLLYYGVELYYRQPINELVLVIQTLFAIFCLGYLFLDLFKKHAVGLSRGRKIALCIIAVLIMVIPLIGQSFFDHTNSQLLLMFSGSKVFLVYMIVFICVFGYEWISGVSWHSSTSRPVDQTETSR